MTIKHIVICGGGEVGFIIQGILTKLYENQVWHHDNIESIYSTSIGCLIALSIVLKIDIEVVNQYMLERPLDKLLDIEPHMLFNLVNDKGIFDKEVINKYCAPLLKSVNLPLDITLNDLYKYSGIEFNVFVSELNNFESIQFSHKTHPEYKVLDVLNMSCSIPMIFKPILVDDKCYFDGGLFNNFPIKNCLIEQKCCPSQVLAF